MTAFARVEVQTMSGTIAWEMRCVNHRYFDPHFYLPDQFVVLEMKLREKLREQLFRGRCDATLRFTPQLNAETLQVNAAYAAQILAHLQTLSEKSALPLHCDGLELLRWPGVMQTPAFSDAGLHAEILQVFGQALEKLVVDRRREGEQIKQVLLQRLQQINSHYALIKQRIPELLPLLHERLLTALQTLPAEMDQARLAQEIVYLANKSDVQEECDRFMTHLGEFNDNLVKGGTIGRRLDFLLQEIQREINTLGNKANDKTVSQCVVEIKVLIEQIREQVQNVE